MSKTRHVACEQWELYCFFSNLESRYCYFFFFPTQTQLEPPGLCWKVVGTDTLACSLSGGGDVQSFISKSCWHVSVSSCSAKFSQCSSWWNTFTVKNWWHFLRAFTQVAVEMPCGTCSSFHDCRALPGEIFKRCSTLALRGYTPFVDSVYDFWSLLGLVSSELNIFVLLSQSLSLSFLP